MNDDKKMAFSDFEGTYHIMDTLHEERRQKLEEAGGCGDTVCGVLWDKGHRRGMEVHVLTTNAIIFIFNYMTGKLVTFKFARPGQVRQLFGKEDIVYGRVFEEAHLPSEVMQRAMFYKSNGWNNI